MRQPLVYWIRLTAPTVLHQQWKKWELQLQNQVHDMTEPKLPLHCTLLYDEIQKQEDYKMLWKEKLNKPRFSLTTTETYVGPQGVAAALLLPNKLEG